MKEFLIAFLMGTFIFVLCLLTTYARSKGIAALIASIAFFGFISFVLGMVAYETVLELKRKGKK